MAWYYGKFSCGHDGRVNVIGPHKNRQYIIDKKFAGLCPECYEKWKEEEKERKNREAMEAAKEMELPELHGSEKQIAWAVTLRQNKIEEFEKYRERIAESRNCRINAKNVFNIISTAKDIEKAIEEVEELFQVTLASLTSATSWINTRFDSIEEILQQQKKNIKITEEKEIEKEIEKEGIVSSENTKYKGYVFIDKQENVIFAVYEKNEEFINIMKSLSFSWSGSRWERKINQFSGPAKDRMAEAGNKLLQSGFSISILDEEIRNAAVNGEFKPECKRWVKWNDTYHLALCFERNDRLYQTGKKIPSARYRSGTLYVNVSHWEEVQEYAKAFGFQFSQKALEEIEKYKSEMKEAQKVTPVIPVQEDVDNLKEILNSSQTVLEDLVDED